MNILLALFSIWAVWKWTDIQNWKEYHSSMLFISIGNLTYFYFCNGYYLWIFESDMFLNETFNNLIHVFIILPATAIIFLSRYPSNRIVFYYAKWISLFITIETIIYHFGYLTFNHGWNLGWSLLFYLVLFPMLRIHYKRPIMAYGLSILVIVVLLNVFDVPIHLPLDKR